MLEVMFSTVLVAFFAVVAVLFWFIMVAAFSFVIPSMTLMVCPLVVSFTVLAKVSSSSMTSWLWMATLLVFFVLMRMITSSMGMFVTSKLMVWWRSLSDNFFSMLLPSVVAVMACLVNFRHEGYEDNNISQ